MSKKPIIPREGTRGIDKASNGSEKPQAPKIDKTFIVSPPPPPKPKKD